MAQTDDNFLDGFSAIGDFLINPEVEKDGSDGDIPELDVDDAKKALGQEDEEEIEIDEKVDEEEDEDEISIEDQIIKDSKPKKDEIDDDEDDPELESDITKFFQGKLAEKLGWEFGEDEQFDSVEGLVEYMSQVVEESSKPEYANEEVEKYDEFVRNGGNLRDFYEKMYSGKIDLSKIDLDSEYNQKLVIRESLKAQGIKDNIIDKRIERYDEAGVLRDEADESFEFLKENDQKQAEKLLEEEKINSRLKHEQQQKFIENVQKTIKEMDSIGDIKLSEVEKRKTLDYIFKPTADGLTEFQKDYQSDVKNLIISAYFTKNKDTLIKKVKEKATSDAYKEIQQKLKVKKQKRDKGSAYDGNSSSFSLGSIGSSLLKKI